MKKVLIFLLSGILLWKTIRLLQESRIHLPSLSPRERDILSLIAEGYTDNEISESLRIGARTIEGYLFNILKKLNLHDVCSAISYAIENEIVSITYA